MNTMWMLFVILLSQAMLLSATYQQGPNQEIQNLKEVKDVFGSNHLKRKRSQAGTMCEKCENENAYSTHYFGSDESNAMDLCRRCAKSIKQLKRDDRGIFKSGGQTNHTIQVTKNKNERLVKLTLEEKQIPDLVVAKLVWKVKEKIQIEILQGISRGTVITTDEKAFTKILSEFMKDDKICKLCTDFEFNCQTCLLCEQKVCEDCYQKWNKCAFCRLLYPGNTVKVNKKLFKDDELAVDFFKQLQEDFQTIQTEFYGIIKEVKLDDKKILYRVTLTNDYEWKKDDKGKTIYDNPEFILKGIPNDYLLWQWQVETFKPNPPSNLREEIHFDVLRFTAELVDITDNLSRGESTISDALQFFREQAPSYRGLFRRMRENFNDNPRDVAAMDALGGRLNLMESLLASIPAQRNSINPNETIGDTTEPQSETLHTGSSSQPDQIENVESNLNVRNQSTETQTQTEMENEQTREQNPIRTLVLGNPEQEQGPIDERQVPDDEE